MGYAEEREDLFIIGQCDFYCDEHYDGSNCCKIILSYHQMRIVEMLFTKCAQIKGDKLLHTGLPASKCSAKEVSQVKTLEIIENFHPGIWKPLEIPKLVVAIFLLQFLFENDFNLENIWYRNITTRSSGFSDILSKIW